MQVLIQLEVQGMFNRVVRLVGGHGLRDIVWRLGEIDAGGVAVV